jgi:glycosyltransferase involved in cell wall biosynthesis
LFEEPKHSAWIPSILQVHAKYADSSPSGENIAVDREWDMLRRGGVRGRQLIFSNNDFYQAGTKLAGIRDVMFGDGSLQGRLAELCSDESVDVVHVHNLFPRPGGRLLRLIRSLRLPIIMTIHNFRLGCANGLHLRRGIVCTKCSHLSFPAYAPVHACYQDSHSKSIVAAAILGDMRLEAIRTVDKFIVLTEFHKEYLTSIGIAAERISVKENVICQNVSNTSVTPRRGFAFVGRLSQEKGVLELLKLWKALDIRQRLDIYGDGPLRDEISTLCSSSPVLKYWGAVPYETIRKALGHAVAVVVPSKWFEGFPNVIAEAMCQGTPFIANNCGALPVIARTTGAGFSSDLTGGEGLREMVQQVSDSSRWQELSAAAVKFATERLEECSNRDRLLRLYADVSGRGGDAS